MPVAAALGGTIVGLDALDEAATDLQTGLQDFVDSPTVNRKFSVTVGENEVTIGPPELVKAREAKSETNPFQGVGSGKPLTIVIEHIYLGDYPDSMPWVPWVDAGDVLVTSAHKAFETFEAAPRAVHLLKANAKRRRSIGATATEQGSQLVYYAPAVTDSAILFSVELTVDRDLNQKIGGTLGKAVATAGALPVFAPAAPFLVAAGIAIPIAANAVNLLARPNTFFSQHVELNMDRPGVRVVQPGALVLYPGSDEGLLDGRYKVGEDFQLRDETTKKPYRGPLPYVVISLDGRERPAYEEWSATAASAVLLERFFSSGEVVSKALEIVTESMTLYNDMAYRKKAADALAGSKDKSLTAPKRQEQKALYQTYLKNIRTSEIRETVKA
jgi:hypothetical protein